MDLHQFVSEYGHNLVSLAGIIGLMAFAWVMSVNRRRLNWRAIGWGVGFQLLVGLFVFRLPGSTRVFLWLNDRVLDVLGAATEGQRFLFGNGAATVLGAAPN